VVVGKRVQAIALATTLMVASLAGTLERAVPAKAASVAFVSLSPCAPAYSATNSVSCTIWGYGFTDGTAVTIVANVPNSSNNANHPAGSAGAGVHGDNLESATDAAAEANEVVVTANASGSGILAATTIALPAGTMPGAYAVSVSDTAGDTVDFAGGSTFTITGTASSNLYVVGSARVQLGGVVVLGAAGIPSNDVLSFALAGAMGAAAGTGSVAPLQVLACDGTPTSPHQSSCTAPFFDDGATGSVFATVQLSAASGAALLSTLVEDQIWAIRMTDSTTAGHDAVVPITVDHSLPTLSAASPNVAAGGMAEFSGSGFGANSIVYFYAVQMGSDCTLATPGQGGVPAGSIAGEPAYTSSCFLGTAVASNTGTFGYASLTLPQWLEAGNAVVLAEDIGPSVSVEAGKRLNEGTFVNLVISSDVVSTANLTLSPAIAAIGQTVTYTVSGATAGNVLTLYVGDNSNSNSSGCAGADHEIVAAAIANFVGGATGTFTVPAGACTEVPISHGGSAFNAASSVTVTTSNTGAVSDPTSSLSIPATAIGGAVSGSTVSITGTGYMSGESVSIAFAPTEGATGTTVIAGVLGAQADGSVSGTVPLSSSLTPGSFSVQATGMSSGFVAQGTVSPYITLTPAWQAPGGTVTVSGYGFAGGSGVTLAAPALGVDHVLTANASGSFAYVFTVPPSTAIGNYTIQATDGNALAVATLAVATSAVTISPTLAAIGQTVSYTVSGAISGNIVTLYLGNNSNSNSSGCATATQFALAVGLANSSGTSTGTFIVPWNACTEVPTVENGTALNAASSVTVTALGTGATVAPTTALAIPATAISANVAGTTAAIAGSGFQSGEAVDVSFVASQGLTSPVLAGSITAAADGTLSGSVPVPGTLAPGTYFVLGAGQTSGFTADGAVGFPLLGVLSCSAGVTVLPGQILSISGSAFAASTGGVLSINTAPAAVGPEAFAVDASGAISTTVTIPTGSTAGEYTLTVSAQLAGVAGTQIRTCPINVITPARVVASSATSGYLGATTLITGTGFAPGEPVDIALQFRNGMTVPGFPVRVTASSTGTISTTLTVSSPLVTLVPGTYNIVVSGEQTGDPQSMPFTVLAAWAVQAVTVTDLSGGGFAVTFTTSGPTTAWLAYGSSAGTLSSVAYDDRDGGGPALTASSVHRITLSGLIAGQTYYFEPVVGGSVQAGPGGQPYSQAVPVLAGQLPTPAQVIGTVVLSDSSQPLSGTVLLSGYWSNANGSQSAPLSVLNVTAFGQGYNYDFGTSIPLTQDGSAYFTLGAKSVFHVSGAGDQSGQLGSGGPVSATVAKSGATTLPSFRISLAVSVTYTVQRGWNLLSLPLSPTTPLSASTLLAGLLAQTGGNYAEIDGFTNGQWAPSYFQEVRPTPLTGGSDYTLALGQGYALYSDMSGTVAFSGVPASAQTVSLARGWNLVGFPDAVTATTPLSASAILSGLLGQTGGNYAELDGFTNGAWAPSSFQEVSPSVVSPSDYSVVAGQGYALYTDIAGDRPL